MQKQCNICESPLSAPIYDSHSAQSLTSLCQLYPANTQVWFCENCGHILSDSLAQTEEYYANSYKILLNHDDEDQIYEVIDEKVIYRTDHQLKVLLNKLKLQNGQKILDYGCAKATMAKKLLVQMPELDFYFFDVSQMYHNYWERLTAPENCAVNHTPTSWIHHFDLITSYFSLEHIPNLRQSVQHIASLLKDEGVFYAIVPDTFGNIADFVVVDHVNHFTVASITRLLQDEGFVSIEVDAQSHRGALIVVACKQGERSQKSSLSDLPSKVQELAQFWNNLDKRIAEAEIIQSGSAAIYGSGFYGAYIYSHLRNPATIQVFLDQSPFQQGRTLFDVPIVSPTELPETIKTLYVGLNPTIARQVIASQEYLNYPGLQIVFLDASI